MNNRFFYHILLVGLFFLTSASAFSQRLNQIQVIGSHNSYKRQIEPALFAELEKLDRSGDAHGLQYTHIPILEQLDKGLRSLEIDVVADTEGGKFAHPKGLDMATPQEPYDPEGKMKQPGFKVFHMLDVDFRTWYYLFTDALDDLKKWSIAHPDHTPIVITLEPKDGQPSRLGTAPEMFTAALFDQLDETIRQHLGSEKLITPNQVKGNYATLEAGVLHQNWPSLEASKGKFLFMLDDSGAKRDLYKKDHPSLAGRVAFVNVEPGQPEAATLFRNDPFDKAIPTLVKKGYFIRTRADANTEEARKEDYRRFEAAKKSGAQVITTDYYLPSSIFRSTYKVAFKDGSYFRPNPVLKN